MTRSASAMSRIGTWVDEKYLIIDSLGKGGMSHVWLARDERLGKLWAIKEIKPSTSGVEGEVVRQALIDEANFMKRLDHPAIPRIVDIVDTGRTIYVVMDYVEGVELSRALAEQGHPFGQQEVIEWGIQLCDVLGYLHARRPPVIYRDLKPSNIMLRDDGSLRLIDFGVCMECETGINNDGKMVGTPGYAPPEQIPQPMPWPLPEHLDPSVAIDGRSDVYALGATLYSLVTGHVPKRTEDGYGNVRVDFRMRPIRMWNPRLSEGLERIILTATQTDSSRRYASVAQMRYDLERYEELTDEWRSAQRKQILLFRRRLIAALAMLAGGLVCLALCVATRTITYRDVMRQAGMASYEARGGSTSEAERLYTQAIELMPGSTEPYSRLLEVYEHDYVLTQAEDDRWRKAFQMAHNLENSEDYAQLCFDAGVGYLSYFRADDADGSVGSTGLACASAAAPWFRRVVDACSNSEASSTQRIADADVGAAEAYGVIAEFNQKVTRAGREGRSAIREYEAFWDSLEHVFAEQCQASGERAIAEGVRVRLCQVAVDALSSSTYLAGFARSGIGEQRVRALLRAVSDCVEELRPFAEAREYSKVYGPIFSEIRDGLDVAGQNIANVYSNPVVSVARTAAQGDDASGEAGER